MPAWPREQRPLLATLLGLILAMDFGERNGNAQDAAPIRELPREAREFSPAEISSVTSGRAASPPIPVNSDDVRTTLFRSDRLTKDGLKLATKGATYSANAKLIEVLQLIADHLDAEYGAMDHNEALQQGLTALRESEDFSRSGASAGKSFQVSPRTLGHATPVLRDHGHERIARSQALDLYQTYASRQLSRAVEGVPEGSMALFYLGRLQPYLSDGQEKHGALLTAKVLALEEAALLADPQNFRAANELGVVLAKHGRLEAAREALAYSARMSNRSEAHRNLGLVLQKIGEEQTARVVLARAVQQEQTERIQLTSLKTSQPRPMIQWVDKEQFAVRTAAAEWDASPPVPAAPRTPPRADPPQTIADAKNTLKVVRRTNPKHSVWRNFGQGYSAVPTAATPQLQQVSHHTGPVSQASPTYTLTGDECSSPFQNDLAPQGEYIGPPRTPHVPEYYLRVEDTVGFVFRLNGKPSDKPYRLGVGDVIRISSLTATNLSVEALVQPDGALVLPQIGTVAAAGRTIDGLRQELEERYLEFLREPSITVSPVSINKTVEELRNAIINRSGIFNGQLFAGKISPNGTIQLPAIGSVPAQGLTLDELRTEVEWRYAEIAGGIEVTPILQQRAPRSVYVLGEVVSPGRFELTGPTTAIQAISLAGGWNRGGNLCNVIVLRRDENWCLLATCINVRRPLYNKKDLAADDIWLRDSDIVIVPKLPIQVADDYIEMWFTRGLYGVVPFNGVTISFFRDLATLGSL